jgi:endonuclease/exonuclease/phosphatase family metal-dependent hydrolase
VDAVGDNGPAVLLGDFNAHPQTVEIGVIGAALTDTWTATPADAPTARIDYIFTGQGLKAEWTRVSTDDPAASDHLPVVSRLVRGGRGILS